MWARLWHQALQAAGTLLVAHCWWHILLTEQERRPLLTAVVRSMQVEKVVQVVVEHPGSCRADVGHALMLLPGLDSDLSSGAHPLGAVMAAQAPP